MNPIQKIWLRVLSPVAYVINEKLAKRSGLLGRIGKFWMIGPREYGSHPFNKMLIFVNRRWMAAAAWALHRYSVIKGMSHNGYHMLRPFRHTAFIGPFIIIMGLLKFVYYGDVNRGYEPDRLTYLSKRIGGHLGIPLNSMNQRTSSHYIEINHIFQAEMVKRYHRVRQRIIDERNKSDDKTKKTRFADPTYRYVAMKPVSFTNPTF